MRTTTHTPLTAAALAEAVVRNKTGRGCHDDKTGHPAPCHAQNDTATARTRGAAQDGKKVSPHRKELVAKVKVAIKQELARREKLKAEAGTAGAPQGQGQTQAAPTPAPTPTPTPAPTPAQAAQERLTAARAALEAHRQEHGPAIKEFNRLNKHVNDNSNRIAEAQRTIAYFEERAADHRRHIEAGEPTLAYRPPGGTLTQLPRAQLLSDALHTIQANREKLDTLYAFYRATEAEHARQFRETQPHRDKQRELEQEVRQATAAVRSLGANTNSGTPAGTSPKRQGPSRKPLKPEELASKQAPKVASTGAPVAPDSVEVHPEDLEDAAKFFRVEGLTAEHLAALTNALPGSKVYANREGGKLTLQMRHPGGMADRTFYRDKQGRVVVHNNYFKLPENLPDGTPNPHRGGGSGLAVFTNQIRALRAVGVDRITTHAAEGNLNGFYTWPRFGYDSAIPANKYREIPLSLRKQMGTSRRVLDLMATPEGRDWWKENGDCLEHSTFDLAPDSRSMKVLQAYIDEQAAKKKEKVS